jgi:pantoate--beta-alanine ligase
MRTLRTVSELRVALDAPRREGHSIGLVPTMGAFHAGHLSLMRRAREECDVVVVSLFVNPTQFGVGEDLTRYPRDEARDAALASEVGVDILFAPPVEKVYPAGFATSVEVADLTQGLCGAHRGAEHFRGVATVVAKLLNMVGPDVAYFGQKDAQQALVIQRMVRDLDFPTQIEICPTIRDEDGLALSSRNAYLDPADRRRALALSRALAAAERAVAEGETDADAILTIAREQLDAEEVEPEYLELVSADSLDPVSEVEGEALLAVAAQVGSARLIDNTILRAVREPVLAGAATGRHQ